jgi:hypothetical protein
MRGGGKGELGRRNLSIADFRFGIVDCGMLKVEKQKLRRWEGEKVGRN